MSIVFVIGLTLSSPPPAGWRCRLGLRPTPCGAKGENARRIDARLAKPPLEGAGAEIGACAMPYSLRLLPSLLAVLLGACESAQADPNDDAMTSGDDPPNGPCVPGQSIACGCGGGERGAAVCRGDGSGFDECVCDGDSAPGSGGSEADGGSSPTSAAETEGDDDSASESGSAEVSFENDIKPILLVSCGGTADACHSRVAYAAVADSGCRGWFSFEDAPLGSEIYAGPTAGQPTGCPDMPLYDRLLQLNSWQCDGEGLPIVVPGDPAASYMMMKIDGQQLCPNGAEPSMSMPPPGEGFGLPESSRATIEAWILAGAPNN
jgi:hypothetical protein